MSTKFPASILDNKVSPFLCRIILGGIFVYAAAGKILYPASFAEAVSNYQLLPLKLTNMVAITLPWIEFVAGLLLLNGFRTKTGNAIIFFCLCLFTVGVVAAIVRGLDINCGCFSEASRRVGLSFLAEEMLLLLMSTYIFYYDRGYLSIDSLLHRYWSGAT
jgi:uncharacterized membrane protein YphA (DoxX/SURF4 family)